MGNKRKNKKKSINKSNKEKVEKDGKYKYNVLFIGETGIGTKTSLIKRIIEGKFIENIEEDEEKCYNFSFKEKNQEFIFYLIDTSGKTDKKDSCENYYKNADCIIMGYDIINKDSFEEIKNYWYKQVKELSTTNLIYLLENKIDLCNISLPTICRFE